jgi:hypothetical protein
MPQLPPVNPREMMTADSKFERDFFVLLCTPHKVNEPWLEDQAVKIEDALIGQCPHILGPSVTANFAENGFELDLTVEASSVAGTYDRLGQALRVVEETAGIMLGAACADEIRSGYESIGSVNHDTNALTTA